jgi:site-specific DNA recombinase
MATPVRRPLPFETAGPIPAAAYIRVSTTKQSDGYSPDIQEEQIRSFAAREGYDLVLAERDAESGHHISREGYQRLLSAVRAGTVRAVLCFMFDRLGRDGGEWITRAREFERLGVPFVSVKEGVEQPGLMRFIRAGLGEEYSRQLAKRVRPAMERSVREGKHHGVAPFGYILKYTERVGGSGRYQAGTLVRDEPGASFVTELFRRYAAGSSLRECARWANGDPAHPKSKKGAAWRTDNLNYTLRNPVYVGKLRYNAKRVGAFETSEPGSEFVIPAGHEPLVDQETFDAVQARLAAANLRPFKSKLRQPDPLAAGILTCSHCGGRMTISRHADEHARSSSYACLNHLSGITVCAPHMYVSRFAHAAILDQVKRLQFLGWDLSRAAVAVETAPNPRPALERQLAAAQEAMRRHVRGFSMMADDPSPVELAAYREVSKELADKVLGLERQLAALPETAPSVLDAKTLHEAFSTVHLAGLVDQLATEGMETELRDLVLKLVASATIIERIPATRSKWLRAAVVWSEPVQALIDAGQVTLSPDVLSPDYSPKTAKELHREAMRRYVARKKAGLVGVVPPAGNGISN